MQLCVSFLVSASSNRSGDYDCTRFPLVAVFYKFGGSPLYSFNIVAMLLSMWIPRAAGVFQTRMNEGEVGKIAGYCSTD